MTHTTQQLQGMSDFEVNQALFEKYMPKSCFCYEADKRDGSSSVFWGTENDEYEVNYCNNPNDIMPLAFERAIGVEKSPLRQEWIVRTCEVNMSNKQFRCYVDTNPLRAIACLLLMMDE